MVLYTTYRYVILRKGAKQKERNKMATINNPTRSDIFNDTWTFKTKLNTSHNTLTWTYFATWNMENRAWEYYHSHTAKCGLTEYMVIGYPDGRVSFTTRQASSSQEGEIDPKTVYYAHLGM